VPGVAGLEDKGSIPVVLVGDRLHPALPITSWVRHVPKARCSLPGPQEILGKEGGCRGILLSPKGGKRRRDISEELPVERLQPEP
jgi:hypothetical protein